MTTERTYICNFCRHKTAESSDVVGLYWANKGLEERPAFETENHLCGKCLRAILNFGKTYYGWPTCQS